MHIKSMCGVFMLMWSDFHTFRGCESMRAVIDCGHAHRVNILMCSPQSLTHRTQHTQNVLFESSDETHSFMILQSACHTPALNNW